MKLIYKHENRGILYSVKNVLEQHGIETHVKNDFSNTMGAEFGLENTLLELWLANPEDYDAAMVLVENHGVSVEGAPDWICENCGETNSGNYGACWKCQTLQGVS